MRVDVAAALGMFAPAAALSALYSSRVALAFALSLVIVGPIELAGVRLDGNHPLRFALPAIVAGLGCSEIARSRATWSGLPKAYVMGLLTFAIAGVDVVALFFHVLGGSWIVPGFNVLVCLLICVVALVPKGRIPWLLS